MNNKKDNKSYKHNERLLKNINKIKELSRQIQPNFLQMNLLKNKSFFVNNKTDNNLSKNISYKNTSNNKKPKPKNKKMSEVNHKPSISIDFSLSLEFGSLMNINKEENNENNINKNQNKLIKVNTKRNNYKNNLPLRAQCKTNKKIDINRENNFESNQLFKNISEINIFNDKNKSNKNILKYEYDIKKIIIIQKWWKILFLARKSQYNTIKNLIMSIKKLFLFNSYIILKKTSPSISYFFHKWNRIITKPKIIKELIKKYSSKINKAKNIKKDKNKNNKIPQNKNNLDSFKSTKKSRKNNKKLISFKTSTNCNKEYSKTNEKNNYCQTTKFNSINNKINYINFNLPLNNNKKRIPNSPKSNLITERYTSPTNNLGKKCQTKKSSFLKNNNKKDIKKDEEKNKMEKKTQKIKSNIITNKTKKRKILKKSIGETKIEQKLKSKLNNIISHNNSTSKNEIQSGIEDGFSEIISNPNSQFNNYIININKKGIEFTPYYYNYSREDKNENKIINDENFNVKINSKNNKSEYSNTDANHNIINALFKTQLSKSNSKIYENHLYKVEKYKNFPFQEKREYFKINNNIENKKYKNNNKCANINKNVILHKKEKKKLSINKEFSNHKRNINFNLTNDTSNAPKNEINTSLNKVNSLENNTNNTISRIKNRNLLKAIYFDFWKERIDKKVIMQKFINFSNFIYHIKHYKKIISLKNSIQEFIKLRNKEQFYQYVFKSV